MRRLLALALPAVLALGAPASAPAKGILDAKVCGSDGCRQVDGPDESLLGGGATTTGPTRGEPFVRLEIRVGVAGNSERIRLLYLPGSDIVLGPDGTTWLEPLTSNELRSIARRVEPFPASSFPASARQGSADTTRAGASLAPEVWGAEPAIGSARATESGASSWWLVPIGAAIALVAGVGLARRRRSREPPTSAASAAAR